ncbi:SDR family NAD(P)-dependent oxidoreductase [Phreatobacter sp. AB_2022a]|uniref:SDR family NAD(P)-dependent oxidoreductase n=1 Tax=Phreatobacter sp. AB_2022a TaxID=3003134 RepID=UPI002287242D|nr:SDR family NAD(P)-dependent oxidoreductase [Phreatobacter sp. AB_2022a]MCZ0736967.1 SDR family NAD(P)-dependent oxidoreductase [Phreatobacter sp. AB_2022a]
MSSDLARPVIYPDLEGRTAFVTGGSGGIGAETCRWLAANGVNVAVGGRNAEALERVVGGIAAAGGEAVAIAADCTDAAALDAARVAIGRRFGPVDILMAFAGGGTARPAPVDGTAEADWRSGIDHNLTATFLTVKAFLPGMRERGAGTIVTMASTAGRQASPASSAYAAAKAGVIMLTRHLAAEVGPSGIRVNCVSPSAILTGRTAAMMPPETRRAVAAMHPLRRLGTPADVAGAALFLASSSASWITGAILDVAGGRLMH